MTNDESMTKPETRTGQGALFVIRHLIIPSSFVIRISSFRHFVTVIAPLLFVACQERGDQTLESIVEQTYDFPPGDELTVRNVDGSIRIYGSDLPGIKLRARKKAYSAERLDKIQVNVSAVAGSTMIDTIFPPKKEGWGFGDRSGTVDYVIVVPDSTRIRNLEVVTGEISVKGLRGGSAKARLTNGRMYSHNCFGDLDLAVTRGRLDFFYDWSEPRAFAVEGLVGHGHIQVFIPSGASFQVDAETTDGRIVNRFGETKIPSEDGTKLKATVGSEPGPRFRIRATHGNIQFEKAY
jgi:hypothetical protein